MSEMVERVAKALYEARFVTTWEEFCAKDRFDSELHSREDWLGFARVAVTAMREPTEGMWEAAVAARRDAKPGDAEALVMWRAMIDECLKSNTSGVRRPARSTP